jgi:hypothetical protein
MPKSSGRAAPHTVGRITNRLRGRESKSGCLAVVKARSQAFGQGWCVFGEYCPLPFLHRWAKWVRFGVGGSGDP